MDICVRVMMLMVILIGVIILLVILMKPKVDAVATYERGETDEATEGPHEHDQQVHTGLGPLEDLVSLQSTDYNL